MNELNTSLLREKFLLHDIDPNSKAKGSTLQAMSNRLVLELKDKKSVTKETLIIRAQNMHSCVRFAARLIKTFEISGPILNRPIEYDWEEAWNIISNEYEQKFNEDRWIAIYHNGRCIFKSGEPNLFLDVIEKCDFRNEGPYDEAVKLAEQAFQQTGKKVRIEHDSNVALVIDLKKTQGRIGVIMRGPSRTTTFNFSINTKNATPINIPQCLAAASCYLEGIQLAFMLGMNTEKIRLGIIERFSKEEKKTREAGRRLARMNAEISNLESTYEVRYRPEKPDFQHIVNDTERMAQRTLIPPDALIEDNEDVGEGAHNENSQKEEDETKEEMQE